MSDAGKQEDIYQDKIEEYHNWNFALNVAGSGFDNLGLSLVGVTTVLPAFLTLFTKSNVIFGLLPAVFVFFWTFPQILSSLYTGHLRQKKNAIVFLRIGYAIPWLVLSILTLFVIRPEGRFSLLIFFVFYSVFALLGGFAVPMWVSFISKLIFHNVRGRFYGLRLFVATSFGLLASFIVKGILDRYEYPLNFSLIFLFAFSVFILGTTFLAISKEPLTPYPLKKREFWEYFSELRETIRKDKRFAWFTISMLVRSFGTIIMGAAFYTVYAIRVLGADLGQAGTFLGIMLSVRLVSGLVMGYVTDVKGPKIIQVLSRLFEFLSAGMILLRPDITGVYVAFGFLGLAIASMNVSYHNTVMELAPKDKVDTYVGLISGIRAPSLAIAPLIGGFLADSFSYEVVFIIALLGSALSGLILLLKARM